MAGTDQQNECLQMSPLSATQFLHIWNHFDSDGNGYIEEKELESFFKELQMSWTGTDVDPSNPTLKEKVKEFVQRFDKNKDGRIEMSELAEILPNQENFSLCFRQFVRASADFLQTWRRYSAAGGGSSSPQSADPAGPVLGGSQAGADVLDSQTRSSPRVPAAACLLVDWNGLLEG
ncbi:unnamed protein product [Tetraodon nigroviridis]|uniref:(spotted green pufferfish) hypothetical protein n=1 Tax=Tetraodon nigroviridis TaxID=99883 RepID=Q4SSF2_TETNG|nr:unnamed protein product [Tetraodon nigroviridis]